jgi:hypothetical protein
MTTERSVPDDGSRFLIDPEMALAHAAQVTALHPRAEGLFMARDERPGNSEVVESTCSNCRFHGS